MSYAMQTQCALSSASSDVDSDSDDEILPFVDDNEFEDDTISGSDNDSIRSEKRLDS